MYDYDIRNDLPMLYDFYIVAKEGSFSQAAEKSTISQSNLSRTIKNLEQKYNLQLFIKNNKGVSLTLDGEKLYKKIDPIFNSLVQKGNDIVDVLDSTIVIGTTRNISDYKLEKYLSKFNKKYPNTKIKILTDSASNLNDYLMKHRIDILIDYLPHINFSEKYELEVKPIGQFNTCFACSKEYYNAMASKIKSLMDLSKYNLVIPGSSRRRQMLDEILQNNNIELNPIVEMPDSKLMIDFVTNNDFIGYFVEEEIKDTNLIKLDIKEELPINNIGIIYHKKTINSIANKFIELVVKDN